MHVEKYLFEILRFSTCGGKVHIYCGKVPPKPAPFYLF